MVAWAIQKTVFKYCGSTKLLQKAKRPRPENIVVGHFAKIEQLYHIEIECLWSMAYGMISRQLI